MSDQDKYSVSPARDTENIRKNYNDDAHKMRAKAAKARIKAKEKAEKDAQQRAAIEKIPLEHRIFCLLYTSPSPRDRQKSRMPSSA